MAEATRSRATVVGLVGTETTLTGWTLATVNTLAFVLALLLPAYASGGLSDVLPTLGTVAGLAVFAYLWLVVWATTRWLLARVDLDGTPLRRLALWAVVCGALDGIVFLLGIVAGLVLPQALLGGLELLSVALIAAFGVPVAAVIGGLVGLAAGTLDLALLRAADAVTPGPARARP